MMKWVFVLSFFLSNFSWAASRTEVGPQCTFDQGLAMGFERTPYEKGCSSETEAQFLFGYRVGRKKFLVQSDLAAKYQETAADTSQRDLAMEPIRKKNRALNQLEVWQAEYPEKLEKNFEEYKKLAPLDAVDVDTTWQSYIKSKGGISGLSADEKMWLQAELPNQEFHVKPVILAVIPGLGLGHALQGRYSDSGWKFTILDGLAMAAYASAGSSSSGVWSLFAMLGVKMWQAWDVGTYASFTPYDIENLKTLKDPSTPGPVIGYVWTF